MGVPITFLDKYNPEQFKIVGVDRYVPDNPRYGHLSRSTDEKSTQGSLSNIGCNGIMGVPITFLDKFNPDQFEIIGLLQSSDEKLAGIPILRSYNDFKEMRQDMTYTGCSGGKANGNPVLAGKSGKGNFLFHPETKEYVHSAYARILIKRKFSNEN